MALTNAQRQARWQAKRKALVQANPEIVERALLEAAARSERDGLSDAERVALADRLADAAMGHLRRAQELAAVARKVRPRASLDPSVLVG